MTLSHLFAGNNKNQRTKAGNSNFENIWTSKTNGFFLQKILVANELVTDLRVDRIEIYHRHQSTPSKTIPSKEHSQRGAKLQNQDNHAITRPKTMEIPASATKDTLHVASKK